LREGCTRRSDDNRVYFVIRKLLGPRRNEVKNRRKEFSFWVFGVVGLKLSSAHSYPAAVSDDLNAALSLQSGPLFR
jgi:hypothetical protein